MSAKKMPLTEAKIAEAYDRMFSPRPRHEASDLGPERIAEAHERMFGKPGSLSASRPADAEDEGEEGEVGGPFTRTIFDR